MFTYLLGNYLVKCDKEKSFIYSVKMCQSPDFYFERHVRKLTHPKLDNSRKQFTKIVYNEFSEFKLHTRTW